MKRHAGLNLREPGHKDRLSEEEKKLAVQMVASGFKKTEAAGMFGVSVVTMTAYMDKYPEIVKEINDAIFARGLLERGRNFDVLVKIRDKCKNPGARLRAIELLEGLAGMQQEKGKDGLKIVFKNQTINLFQAKPSELDATIRELAGIAGPEVVKMVEGQLAGKPVVAPGRKDHPRRGGGAPSETPPRQGTEEEE